MKRKAVIVPAGLVVASLTAAVAAAGAAATETRAGVSWHAQMAPTSGPVEGAWAHLVRTANGISYSLHPTELRPGHAYTLWQVVLNNPAACATHPCTARDVFLNPDAGGQVSYAAGHCRGPEKGRPPSPAHSGWERSSGDGSTTGDWSIPWAPRCTWS